MQTFNIRLIALAISVAFLWIAAFASNQAVAQPSDSKAEGGGDLRAAVQNPVGAMYSLPLKFSFDYGAPNGEASFLNIQPVIPITVGDWNLINRVIIPLIDTPGQVTGTPEIPNPPPGDGATGLGDINYSLFVSPAKPGKFIWGVGPSVMFPTATDDQLGSKNGAPAPLASSWSNPSGGPTVGWFVNCGPLPATMTGPASTKCSSNRSLTITSTKAGT